MEFLVNWEVNPLLGELTNVLLLWYNSSSGVGSRGRMDSDQFRHNRDKNASAASPIVKPCPIRNHIILLQPHLDFCTLLHNTYKNVVFAHEVRDVFRISGGPLTLYIVPGFGVIPPDDLPMYILEEC